MGTPDEPPEGIWINLDDALRLLSALEDSFTELSATETALGLRDELVTLIRVLHDRLGMSPT